MIASEQEIIIIAANYRLGLFGFWFRKGWTGTHIVGKGYWKKSRSWKNEKVGKFEMKFWLKHCQIGWIPGFLTISTPGNETWKWIAQIVKLSKSFEMIPDPKQFAGNLK